MSTIIGYKTLQDGLICCLEIDPELSNLGRTNVVDKNYAKFGCQKATVLSIYTLIIDEITGKTTRQDVLSGSSIYEPDFIYKVGESIYVDDYNPDIESICSEGIHFFLTQEAAYSFSNILTKNSWYSDGGRRSSCDYDHINDRSTSTIWYKNGTIRRKLNFKGHYTNVVTYCDKKRISVRKNGIYDGKSQAWYGNGQLKYDQTYKDGKLVGLSKLFYENGQVKIEEFYENGKCFDSRKEFYDDGQLKNELYFDGFTCKFAKICHRQKKLAFKTNA